MILVRRETSPEDFHGMVAAKAILTARGGMTSHAAVVARGMGKPCVAGAHEIEVDERRGCSRSMAGRCQGRRVDHRGWRSGRVYAGSAPLVLPELSGNFGG